MNEKWLVELDVEITHNGQVLLQVGYFITVSVVLQLGFVLLMKLRTFGGLYSSSLNFR